MQVGGCVANPYHLTKDLCEFVVRSRREVESRSFFALNNGLARFGTLFFRGASSMGARVGPPDQLGAFINSPPTLRHGHKLVANLIGTSAG